MSFHRVALALGDGIQRASTATSCVSGLPGVLNWALRGHWQLVVPAWCFGGKYACHPGFGAALTNYLMVETV